MDLREITSITEQLVTDGVVDETLLKKLEADAEIVSVACTPVIAKIMGDDAMPTDRTLLKRTLLIQHGKPNRTEYVKYTKVLSPHPFVDGLRIMAYPATKTKPSVSKLTHADGLLLGGKSDHIIEPVVNEILKMQTRQSVWLLDAATKYEGVLKQKPNLRVRSSVDGSERGFASDLKTAVKEKQVADVKSSLIQKLRYEADDLPLAIAMRQIDDFYAFESPKLIGKIDTEIVARSIKIRNDLERDIKSVEEETLDRLSTQVLAKPFLKKKKRKSRERSILEAHDDAIIALMEGALKALSSEADLIKSDVIEETLRGYKELVSELRDIDPTFVDSSLDPDLSAPTGVQPSGFTIPEGYSVASSVLERTIWLSAIGYVGEIAVGAEKGAATVAVLEVATGAIEAAAFTVGGSTIGGGTVAIGGGTLVGGGIGSGGLLSGGVMLCEAVGMVGGISAGGVTGGKIGTLVPVPGVATAVGAGVGLVIGGGLAAFQHHRAVKAAKRSFRQQAAAARQKLLAYFDAERQNLIATTQVTAAADVSQTTEDLDSQLSELRDKIAAKFAREKRDVASLSVAELKNRLARYTEYLDQLIQD